LKRDKLSLDVFWIKDKSLTDTDSLPAPEILAAEIADDLEAALEQFTKIAARLRRPAAVNFPPDSLSLRGAADSVKDSGVRSMALGKHTRTEKGTFRRERSDSTAGTLRTDYPEFKKVRADAELGNIKKNLGLSPSAGINKVRKVLREE
jgi:hypothetical protein